MKNKDWATVYFIRPESPSVESFIIVADTLKKGHSYESEAIGKMPVDIIHHEIIYSWEEGNPNSIARKNNLYERAQKTSISGISNQYIRFYSG